MSKAAVSTSSGEGSDRETTFSADVYEKQYILKGSIPALNFVIS